MDDMQQPAGTPQWVTDLQEFCGLRDADTPDKMRAAEDAFMNLMRILRGHGFMDAYRKVNG